jgi:methylphosphotriester-DNA--protein-cysteine methyltransferase
MVVFSLLVIYGRLDCWSAQKYLVKGGYAKGRVFFADDQTAIAAGFRPCGHCLRAQYNIWKRGGVLGSQEYPWLLAPPSEK